jgi:hypothetical protein
VRASRRCWRQGPSPPVEPLDGGRARAVPGLRRLPTAGPSLLAPARALRPSPAALRRLEAARAARPRQGGAEVASYFGGERSACARSPAGWCGGRLASLGSAFLPSDPPRARFPGKALVEPAQRSSLNQLNARRLAEPVQRAPLSWFNEILSAGKGFGRTALVVERRAR